MPLSDVTIEVGAIIAENQRLELRVQDLLESNNRVVEQRRELQRELGELHRTYANLADAVGALYHAGLWRLPTGGASEPEQARLWEAVRDAAGIPKGTASAAGVASENHRPDPYGAAIATNGERPKWLLDCDSILVNWTHSRRHDNWSVPRAWSPRNIDHEEDGDFTWAGTRYIRLYADHWAYTAIKAGFEPWSGGEIAPSDWNRSEVLTRNGKTWTHQTAIIKWGNDNSGPLGIIGYQKRIEPQLKPAHMRSGQGSQA